MAVVGNQLLNRVFGHSKAEQAFHTWWDTIEDYMVYSLVTMGIIVMLTTMVIKMPLHCNFIGNKQIEDSVVQGDDNGLPDDDDFIQGKDDVAIDYTEDPGFNLWWVRKACLFNGSVSPFMLYLPYILLIMALIIFATERVFSKAFKAGLKLEKLYTLLIHRQVLAEVPEDQTDGKEINVAKESFKGSKSYYIRFLIK